MNNAINSNGVARDHGAENRRARKPSRFGWIFDEAILQGLLVVGVVFALVSGALSVGNSPIA